MLPVVSNAESIVSEKSMHDTILPWRNGKNLKKDVILDCSMIKSKLSRAVLLYWKGVSNMSNKRSVQCNADIRVSHDILQALGIHATLCHLGAKGMSAYMWTCQVWNKKIFYSGWKVSNHSNQILQHLYYLLHDYCCPKHLFTIVAANILVNCFKTPEYGKSD